MLYADGDGHVTSWCASGVFVLVRQSDLTVGNNVQAGDHPGSD